MNRGQRKNNIDKNSSQINTTWTTRNGVDKDTNKCMTTVRKFIIFRLFDSN